MCTSASLIQEDRKISSLGYVALLGTSQVLKTANASMHSAVHDLQVCRSFQLIRQDLILYRREGLSSQ